MPPATTYGIVIELLQPCPVKEGTGDEVTTRWAVKGERIILTESTALSRYARAADHATKVYEAFIEPEVSRTKTNQALWIYPTFSIGRPIARTEKHMVALQLEEPDFVDAPQLGMGGAAPGPVQVRPVVGR